MNPLLRTLTAEAQAVHKASVRTEAAEGGDNVVGVFGKFISWLRGGVVTAAATSSADTWLPPHAAFPYAHTQSVDFRGVHVRGCLVVAQVS